MSWFGIKYNQARQQRKAKEKICQLHGWVMYDWAGKGLKPPDCLRNLFGEDMLSSIRDVNFGFDSQVKDEDAVIFENLLDVEFVCLKDTRISDVFLRNFKQLKKLQEISLENTRIGNKGLEYLAECKTLKILDVSNNNIDDYGLKSIQRLENLEDLNLCNTRISEKGLTHLRCLKHLRQLNIHCCSVSSDAVNSLKKSLPGIVIGWDSSDNQARKGDFELPPPVSE
jgi:hypothetical protein